MPPGPGMFSTKTCWPNFSVSLAASMREVTSATPPGPNGSTSRTGFSGHFACAWPTGANAKSKAADTARAAKKIFLMVILPVVRPRFLLLAETIKPGRIVHQQAVLRQRGGGKLRHQVDQIGLVGRVGGIGVREIGAPQHARRRRLDQRAGDRHRRRIRRHGYALGPAHLDPAIFKR